MADTRQTRNGFLLAKLAYCGAQVWLGDINPALCLLASLRSPQMIQSRGKLADWLESNLHKLQIRSPNSQKLEYVDEWIPKNIGVQLRRYRDVFDLDTDPFMGGQKFWNAPLRKRFAAAIPLLAARDIACFRSSDNYTWIKPGGLQREAKIIDPIRRALATWLSFANNSAQSATDSVEWGELHAQTMDAASGEFGLARKADAIITSPPYANRLDYTRMWGPESEVAAAIWTAGTSEIQLNQIGSNIVRGTKVSNKVLEKLPRPISASLEAIRTDADYASEGYYFPFFRNYAASLMNAIRELSLQVKKNGVLVVFVRDTVRKDVLFPTGLLVEKVMHEAGFRTIGRERHIVKRHVGLRRRGAASGLYGVGQQEWWLAFRRYPK